MKDKHTIEDLKNCSQEELIGMVLMMQGRMDTLNESIERLIEQVRLANSRRFGKSTETLESIDNQLSFFDEAEASCDLNAPEPKLEEVIVQKIKKKKVKGQREEDLKNFPEEILPVYSVSEEELDSFYGKGNWRRMPDETYKRLRHEPESWTVEIHTVEVYVGTDGDHQDEFMRGNRPKDLLRGSIVTPSLLASVLNVKYVNSSALYRVEQEFERNGVHISRQTLSNWIVLCSNKYFKAFVERMKEKLLELGVTQSDETPTQVIQDSTHPNSKSYMWVHRSGELYKDRAIVVYEYQRGRSHQIPLEFYKGYNGILMTDALSQYHLIDKKLSGVTNANCWTHLRRFFADAIKASGKKDPESVRESIAYQALQLIGQIFHEEGLLKDLSSEERLQKRQAKVKPLVEAFFAWVKEKLSSNKVLPKGETAKGLRYAVNQEAYLKIFLTNGYVPIDNSACERSLRTFCLGKKNWMFHNTARGAEASALIYSISETAKLNDLRPYYYFKYLLTELPNRMDEEGNIDPASLDDLLPWAKEIPAECRKPRR